MGKDTATERTYSPGSREIVASILEIWKEDKSTENVSYAKLLTLLKDKQPTWSLSEKRMKTCLKEFNLEPEKSLFTYCKLVKSFDSPNLSLPPQIELKTTKAKGKALFALKNIEKGTLLWEESSLVHAVPVELLRLTHTGSACAFCGRSLRTGEHGVLAHHAGVPCTCPANWCSNDCKQSDLIHKDIFHNSSVINSSAWRKFEAHCFENNWRASLLYGLSLICSIKKDPRQPNIESNLRSMAHVSQAQRQKACTMEGSVEYGLVEEMWKQGYTLLKNCFKKDPQLTYEDYLQGIGMVNINNLDGCIFLHYAQLNHGCSPNVEVEWIKRATGIQVRAKSDISAGQELITSYVDPSLPVAERVYQLRVNWGFNCTCNRCKEELKANDSNQTPTMRKRSKSVRFEQPPVTLV